MMRTTSLGLALIVLGVGAALAQDMSAVDFLVAPSSE